MHNLNMAILKINCPHIYLIRTGRSNTAPAEDDSEERNKNWMLPSYGPNHSSKKISIHNHQAIVRSHLQNERWEPIFTIDTSVQCLLLELSPDSIGNRKITPVRKKSQHIPLSWQFWLSSFHSYMVAVDFPFFHRVQAVRTQRKALSVHDALEFERENK